MNNALLIIIIVIVILILSSVFSNYNRERFDTLLTPPVTYRHGGDAQAELDFAYDQVITSLNRYTYTRSRYDLLRLRASLASLNNKYTEVAGELSRNRELLLSCQSRNRNLERQLQNCRRQLAD